MDCLDNKDEQLPLWPFSSNGAMVWSSYRSGIENRYAVQQTAGDELVVESHIEIWVMFETSWLMMSLPAQSLDSLTHNRWGAKVCANSIYETWYGCNTPGDHIFYLEKIQFSQILVFVLSRFMAVILLSTKYLLRI
jgi:hypothetical protein